MYRIQISNELQKKPYFWYLYRCLTSKNHQEKTVISTFQNTFFDESFIELVYINDVPCIFDLRDDFTLSETYNGLFNNEYILFKANYSSEMWQNPPSVFEYKLQPWSNNIKDRIIPFAYGRAFSVSPYKDEFELYSSVINPIEFDLASYSGAGLTEMHTRSRLDVYDLLEEYFDEKACLIFEDRSHFKDKYNGYLQHLEKYKGQSCSGLNTYYSFISKGKYILNFPGIALSQPFRFVDAVLMNRGVISTKIWQDVWKTFPCIELESVCGYFGYDEDKIDYITDSLTNKLKTTNYKELLLNQKKWYDDILSSNGMFTNQILRGFHAKNIN